MIYYFSATGNSKYVAEKVGNALNQATISIQSDIKDYNLQDEIIGIVSPTYFWGLPKNVREFLTKIKIKSCKYLFFISTYGTSSGQSGQEAKELLDFHACLGVKMPDVWTPIFDLTNKEKVNKQLEKAEDYLKEVIDKVTRQEHGNFIKHKVPKVIGNLYHATYNQQSKTSHFWLVDDRCISCGLCERKCPASAIKLKDGKPVWIKEQCYMCLGCLHRCPKFAIQYGKNTIKHGQYKNPYVKV